MCCDGDVKLSLYKEKNFCNLMRLPMSKTVKLILAIGLALGAVASALAAAPNKPNIIFILADDYGTGEVSAYGADNYKTPHIDALAQGGTRYTRSYTLPLCGPSRAMILSGRYPFRTGATSQDASGDVFSPIEQLTPKVLKSAGYVTSMIGKWGQLPLTAGDFGFDDYLQFKGSGVYWNTQVKGKDYLVNGKTIALHDKEYMPDLMHRHLVNFITQNKDKPFFVHYSMSHVHSEILPTPDSAPDNKNLYADNVAYMDKLVGQLVAELERLKLREKTLLVFMGDNGTAGGPSRFAKIGGRAIFGSKGSMQEGGALVPLIANWPGVVPAGKVTGELIDSSDLLPTFAELAGAKLPAGVTMDGRSFAAQLQGGQGKSRDWAFVQLARNWYVREAGFKLTQDGELFDMADAPFAETLVPKDSQDPAAVAARKRLQLALQQLNPAGGIVDQGGESGRHENKKPKVRASGLPDAN
jgi:arylsulfatase A